MAPKHIILFTALCGLGLPAMAQQPTGWQTDTPVDIGTEEVVIVKERENELPPANRPFSQIPPQQIQQQLAPQTYDFNAYSLGLPPIEPVIRLRQIKASGTEPGYNRFVKVGIGNYISPYLEARLSSQRDASLQYSLGLLHESAARGPVDGGKSSYGNNLVDLRGNYLTRNATLSGAAYYERNRVHLYGYDEEQFDPDKDDIKQIYNRLGLNLAARRHATETLELEAGLGFGRTSSYRGAAESRFHYNAFTAYALSDQLGVQAELKGMVSSYEDSTRLTRSLTSFVPSFRFALDLISLQAGLRFTHENDTAFNAGKLHVYPDVRATFKPDNAFEIYAGVNGGIVPITYDTISRINPFLADRVPLLFTNKTIAFQGGIRGRAGSMLGYHAGFEIASLKNQFYFVRDAQDTTAFTLVYDQENAPYTNLFGELSFAANDNFNSRLRFDFYSYEPENLRNAWHMPSYQLLWDNRYNLYDKILLSGSLNVLGGIEVPGEEPESSLTLDPIINIGLGAEYRFSKQGAAFIEANNLLSQEYERFQGYPSRKLLVRIGGSYSF